MKKIIAIALFFSVLFPSAVFAQEQIVTVEYVENFRQQLIDTLTREILRLQKIIEDYIASMQVVQNPIGGMEQTPFVPTPQENVIVSAPSDTTPPKIIGNTNYNVPGWGGMFYITTDEPSKIKVYFVNRNNTNLYTASLVKNSWDDLVDEAYKEELAGNGGVYETQTFQTSTKIHCVDAGMSVGEHYITRFEATDTSGNSQAEQYLRGKKYSATVYCE